MEFEVFIRLEKEIDRALEVINRLKEEKEELEFKNQELQAHIRECEENIRRLEVENQRLREDKVEGEVLLARQYQIRDKVKGILAKFDEL